MPVSHYRHIASVLSAVEQYKAAKSILEIGPGFGKYGTLLRERFDVRFERYYKHQWLVLIDCLEIYQPYITPVHNYLYDHVLIGDIVKEVETINNYDIILMLEVLEHLPKDVGKVLLPKLMNKTNYVFVVSFPRSFREGSGSEWPNPYEEHKCLWTKAELDNVIGLTTAHSQTVFSKVK